MVGVASDLNELAVLNVIQKPAGVRAVLRASAFDDAGFADVNGHRFPYP
jgi:hypothetical protein